MSSEKTENRKWVRAHCHSCDWDGYTDNLDDACYGCGEYESLKEISDCCDECGGDLDETGFCGECGF